MKKILLLIISLFFTLSSFAYSNPDTNDDDIKIDDDIKLTKKTSGATFSQSKFVPDISLIADLSYAQRNLDDAIYNSSTIPKIHHGLEPATAHRGFNLNYVELSLFSIVDPYFDLFTNLAFSEDAIVIEEAYFSTRSLPLGFKLKAGKFLSHFGRVNEQHAHHWDFVELPLIHSMLFGDASLDEVGARISWVAPLDTYVLLGLEILRGENSASFGYQGFSDVNNTVSVSDSKWPNTQVVYIKSSFDIGSLTVLYGFSTAFGTARINNNLDNSGSNGDAIHADSRIYGADITLKYMLDSSRYIAIQSEYLYRFMQGDSFSKDTGDAITMQKFKQSLSGFYAQLITKLSKRLRFGLRYDLIHNNKIWYDDKAETLPDSLFRYAAMVEVHFTEFSRFRLQYNHDYSKYQESAGNYNKKINREIILQCNLAIGAHGAHAF